MFFGVVIFIIGIIGIKIEPVWQFDGEEIATTSESSHQGRWQVSLENIGSVQENITTHSVNFESPRTMISVKIGGVNPDELPRLALLVDGKKIPLNIDETENDGFTPDTDFITTEPVFLEATRHVTVVVNWGTSTPGDISVVGINTDAHTWKIAWKSSAQAKTNIITRAEWGADEELRFADTDAWKKILKKNTTYKPTAADKKAAAKRLRIYNWLHKDYPQEFEGATRATTENGRKLIWPIENGGYVNKIVVHHTGEWSDASEAKLSDEASIVRGIYYYHSQVRQWGDIGYNFIVGKSGKIYEGRAGGDYAVAAHAVWNNQNAVGVSLMGAYNIQSPPQDQIIGLVKLIAHLSKKYGIDLSNQYVAHRECVGRNCAQDGETVWVPGLSGHRDVGHTNCPGENLYPYLEKIRRLEQFSRGRTTVYRTETKIQNSSKTNLSIVADKEKEPIVSVAPTPSVTTRVLLAAESAFSSESPVEKISAPEQKISSISTTALPAKTPSTPIDPAAKSVDTRLIRIKLSMPDLTTLKIAPTGGTMKLVSGKKTATAKNYLIFEKSGKTGITVRLAEKSITFSDPLRLSGEVLEILNWKRIPAWDKSGTINDNSFRGTLEIRNRNGKWLIINELPVGDYVKGLGEVSDGDPEHKAKTIIVAARTYAAHYLQSDKRKFPGEPYDGSDDPAVFQRYLGYGLEKRSPNLAKYAQETRNTIITYSGALIKPWYFNASPGKTRSALEYCQSRGGKTCEDIPFLQSVEDPGTPVKTYNGHGVGISGNGAIALAQRGWTFENIIRYFLKGVEVQKIE